MTYGHWKKSFVCAAEFIHGIGQSSDFERLYEYYSEVALSPRSVLLGSTDAGVQGRLAEKC
jgi:hypothetical protein